MSGNYESLNLKALPSPSILWPKYFTLLLEEGVTTYCTILKFQKKSFSCMIISLKSCMCLYYESNEGIMSHMMSRYIHNIIINIQ